MYQVVINDKYYVSDVDLEKVYKELEKWKKLGGK